MESYIVLDVYAYTFCYMEVKPLQKSKNSVYFLGSADFHLHYFCDWLISILFYCKVKKICLQRYCLL